MAARWQMIPQKVITEEKRKKVADSWMTAQRTRMSQEWQDRQLGQAGGQVGTEQPGQPDVMDRIKQANEWMAKAAPTALKSAIPLVGPGLAMGKLMEPITKAGVQTVESGLDRYRKELQGPLLNTIIPRPGNFMGAGGIAPAPTGQVSEAPPQTWENRPEPVPGYKGAIELAIDPLNAVPLPGAKVVGKGAEMAGPLLKGALEKAPLVANKALDVVKQLPLGAESGGAKQDLALDLGGAGIGAVSQYDPNATPEENLKRMAAGGFVGFGAARVLRDRKLGLSVEDVTKGKGAAVPPVKPPTAVGTTTPGQGKFAGNIRLGKYPQELQSQIQAAFDAAPEKFEAARRNVIPDAQVQEQARALVQSVGGNFQKQIKGWQKGQAWNAEEILALREVLTGKTQAVLEAQQAVRQADSTENLAKLQLALTEQATTQEMVAGVTAEAGRALRQFRQTLSGAIASGDQAKMGEILDKLGGRVKTEEIAKGLSQIDVSDQEAVFKFIRNSMKPELGDYITEIFYNSILSGPRTHLVNAIGNTLSTLMAPIERAAAGAVDVGLSAATGAPRSRFAGEVAPEVFGMARGLPEGVTKALYVLRKGYSLDDIAKLEIRRPQAFKGTAGDVLNMPSRFLAASDALFRSVNYSGALNAGAYRLARQEGLKGEQLASRTAELLADPPKQLLDEAGNLAAYRVFQSKPGQVTQALGAIRDIKTVGGIQPLRFVLPFLQTPANLLKYGLERSPLGLLNPKLWKNVAAKSPEASDQLGRALIGSTVAAALGMYAAEGKITGPVPTNAAERDAFYRSGKQPFAIQIGDKWVPYSKLEPFNQPLSQVAAVVQAVKSGKKEPQEIAGQVVATIGQNMISQTYLSGLSDLMNALQDPERYGSNVLERVGVAMAVPFSAATRTAAQVVDPTVRKPEGLGEELKTNIPGLSQQVPARLNAFGEPVQRETSALSPLNVTTESSNPVDQELARLKVNIGFTGNTVHSIPLSREEQYTYQQLSGQIVKELLTRAIANSAYQNQSDVAKTRVLQTLITKGKDLAADQMIQKLGPERVRQAAIKKAGG